MFLDQSISFNTTLNTPQVVSATATSAKIIDITGAGVGNAPAMIGGYPNTNNAIGADFGIGDGVAIPRVSVLFTAAGTGTGTISVSLQEAVDNGSYNPGTWNTVYTGPAFVGSSITSGSDFSFALPSRLPGTKPPRFYQLVYTVTGTASVPVLAFIAINQKSSLTGGQYPNNFLVA